MTQIKYLLIITTEKELPQAVHLTYLLATVYFGDVFKDLPVSQATSLLRYLCDQICLNLSHSPFLASCFESICIFFFFYNKIKFQSSSFQYRMLEKSQHENRSHKHP